MSEFVIGRRQLFILPTRVGWYFALILLALFAIAIKFDNQAAFMMLFLLVAVGIVGMHYTHNNVIGLELKSESARAVFAGENARFPVTLINRSAKDRQAIWLICAGFHQVFDLNNQQQKQLQIKLPTVSRGYFNCPRITLSSQFPLGIFFCWSKRFENKKRCIVYPQPLNLVAYPQSGEDSNQDETNSSVTSNNADYSGMKPYQEGDRPRDIHWPSLAKTQKLITIQHEEITSNSTNLSWFSLPNHLSNEDKLSQLCFWIIKAEKEGIKYQLEMPNHTIQYNNGLAHFHECLKVLALWGKS
ncbi:MAG: DUF58 domain-containing protein [Acidiferrobacterales bacterium]|nr:DUF58 domain-containing protein [Acidiferrobacterales bacterium]